MLSRFALLLALAPLVGGALFFVPASFAASNATAPAPKATTPPESTVQCADEGQWKRVPGGSRPAYAGIQGGTVPVSLLQASNGTIFVVPGRTGNDFTHVLRGTNGTPEVTGQGAGRLGAAPQAQSTAGGQNASAVQTNATLPVDVVQAAQADQAAAAPVVPAGAAPAAPGTAPAAPQQTTAQADAQAAPQNDTSTAQPVPVAQAAPAAVQAAGSTPQTVAQVDGKAAPKTIQAPPAEAGHMAAADTAKTLPAEAHAASAEPAAAQEDHVVFASADLAARLSETPELAPFGLTADASDVEPPFQPAPANPTKPAKAGPKPLRLGSYQTVLSRL